MKTKKLSTKPQSPIQRHNKVINDMVENGSPMGKAMRKANYSKAYSKHPEKLKRTKQFKEATQSIVKQLKKERQRAIARLSKTINKAKYRDLNDGIDKLTKNIQLLSGKSTAINKVEIDDSQYQEILKREQNRLNSTQDHTSPQDKR